VHEEQIAVADREHVGVEGAGVDAARVLLREHQALGGQAMQARDRLAGLERLARRVAARRLRLAPGAPAPGEQMGGAAGADEARVIGRALVAELAAAGQRPVHREPAVVGEDGAEDRIGDPSLDGPVKHGVQVGRRDMQPPVGGVDRRRRGSGVGGPHRRGARHQAQEIAARRLREQRLVGQPGAEAETPKHPDVGTRLRRQHRLTDA